MEYKGVIKKSRTLDLAALSTIVDAAAPILVALQPDDVGVTVAAWAIIRAAINGLSAYLRFRTTGPVGDK